MSDGVVLLLFSLALMVAVGIGEGLRALAKWSPEASRRAVHVLTGFLVVIAVPLFSEPTWIYVLALLFVGVNLLAIGRRIFPGMHGIQRKSWGTATFPLALIFALFTCWTLDAERVYILQIAFLVLAISDPLASYAGARMARPGRYRMGSSEKSLAGTVAFASSAVLLVAIGLALFAPDGMSAGEIGCAALAVGLAAAAAEALGGRGWDNLAIVVAVVVSLVAIREGVVTPNALLGVLAVAGVFGMLAFRVGFLSLSGALAASVLGFALLGLGGLPWLIPALTFFVLSSALSSIGKERKEKSEALAEKTSRRDSGQVLANGGVGGMLLITHLLLPHPALYWAFVGSFAAAAADTWATEIGTYFHMETRHVLTLKRVQPGESGGISVPGTLGAVLGAGVVAMSAIPSAYQFPVSLNLAGLSLLLISGGVVASLVDSLLGASLQAGYRDSCGSLTERSSEDGHLLPLVRGTRWMTNDRVNLACTSAGALVPLTAFLLAN